jgi:TRAP-type C4-dicarboxylate transport system substrate-binding protein
MTPGRIAVAAPIAVALAATALTADAKTLKITIVAPAPSVVTYVKLAKERYIPEVNKRIAATGKDFKIRWVEAYGSSLAKPHETMEAVEENIAQMGLLVKNFEEAKLSLDQYPVMAPFTNETMAQIIDIDAKLRKNIPGMNAVYAKYGLRFMVSGVTPNYNLFTTFPVKSIDDLKGRKIGVSGVLGQYFRGTEAVTVNSAMIHSFTSIRSGVYEGYPISIALAFPFKTYEAAKFYTQTDFGVSGSTAMVINDVTWQKIPGYAQEIMTEIATDWPKWMNVADTAKTKKFAGIMQKKGVKFTTLSPEERKRWVDAMPNIAMEWAARQDKKGLPGTKVMSAYLAELRNLKVNMLRDWGKE